MGQILTFGSFMEPTGSGRHKESVFGLGAVLTKHIGKAKALSHYSTRRSTCMYQRGRTGGERLYRDF